MLWPFMRKSNNLTGTELVKVIPISKYAFKVTQKQSQILYYYHTIKQIMLIMISKMA